MNTADLNEIADAIYAMRKNSRRMHLEPGVQFYAAICEMDGCLSALLNSLQEGYLTYLIPDYEEMEMWHIKPLTREAYYLAELIILALALCRHRGIDVVSAIHSKHALNQRRETDGHHNR